MSKFKVGDKVKIVNPESPNKDCLGDVTTIVDDNVGPAYPYKDTFGRLWCDDELELLEEQVDKVDSLYPYLVQPNFELSPELQHEWENQDIKPVYIKGIKEEKEMNKVLNLWFERKQEKIIKKYAEMEQDFINNHYSVVKSYNELVEQFEKDLDDLYKFDKVNEQFVLEEISDKNTIKYDIDFDKLSCEFTDKHIKEKQGELKELAKIREEVEAQLSLSNELKYQQEVLIQYNIIDKKTKKIVE